jgi:lipoate---protein ligase
MLYIYNPNTNPYFNLAVEEYVLKEFKEECFMLWRNAPSIIVGKNQNALGEINVDYVTKNNIPVVRRLSGGGAVFHDLGNLNFTFIVNDAEDNFTNFKKFTQPILDVLRKLSVDAEFSGRNDLTIEGKKFSGNAQYNFKNRILHHGTILFSSDMTDLSAALRPKQSKFEGKSVKSVQSRVTNISQHLKSPLTIFEFIDLIMKHVTETDAEHIMYELTSKDIEKINKMVETKYGLWDWNFGTSPKYQFSNEKKLTGGSVEINLNVEKGKIADVRIFGDFFGKCDVSDVEKTLIGTNHSKDSIHTILSSFDLNNYFANIALDDLVELFF